MHEIFVSYSCDDRDAVAGLVRTLEEQYGDGAVWWDQAIEARAPYAREIAAALEAARAVVVVWSEHSVTSDWVYSEATRAQGRQVAVHASLGALSSDQLPMPFDAYRLFSLQDTRSLLKAIGDVWSGHPVPTRIPLNEIYEHRYGRPLLDARRVQLPAERDELLLTDLLQARHGIVSYSDTRCTQQQLLDWCLSTHYPVVGRMVHGPGGIGKTRLLIEVAEQLRAMGWDAGFLDDPTTPPSSEIDFWPALTQLLSTRPGPSRALLVIDYAENRQPLVLELASLLVRLKLCEDAQVRVVLLARSEGQWWTDLLEENPNVQRVFRQQSAPGQSLRIDGLVSTHDREQLFASAICDFRPHLSRLGLSMPTATPSREWLDRLGDDAGYDRPLSVQMLALLWLVDRAQVPGEGVGELLQRVLGLERGRWHQLLGSLSADALRELKRAVAQATLVRPESKNSIVKLLASDAYYRGERSPARLDTVATQLMSLYGSPEGGAQGIQPDLLGQQYVAAMADETLVDACLDWVHRSLNANARSERAVSLIAVLQRAMNDEHPQTARTRAHDLLRHVTEKWLPVFAHELVSVTRTAPDTMLGILGASLNTASTSALEHLIEAVPGRSVTLDDLVAQAAQQRVSITRQELLQGESTHAKTEALLSTKARLLSELCTLATRLGYAGNHADAQKVSQEVVDTQRALVRERPDDYLPDLAFSLNRLGVDLANHGQQQRALAATAEAVELYRQLEQSAPGKFTAELARSLTNCSRDLANVGRLSDALAASKEAFAIYRASADPLSGPQGRDLVIGLNNLSVNMDQAGHPARAWPICEMAVAAARMLSKTNLDAYLPDLALCLNTLGVVQLKLGRVEAARQAHTEAASIRRSLADARPEAFADVLTVSLNNLGRTCATLGKFDEALVACREAVTLQRGRQHDTQRPRQALADALDALSCVLLSMRQEEAALPVVEEADRIYAQLSQLDPSHFQSKRASIRGVYALALFAVGRTEDAVTVSRDTVRMYRELADASPTAFLAQLGESLVHLGRHLHAADSVEEAIVSTREGVTIHQALAHEPPELSVPRLARSLSVLAYLLANAGRLGEAAAESARGFELLLPHVDRAPEQHGSLAQTLANQNVHFSQEAGLDPSRLVLSRASD